MVAALEEAATQHPNNPYVQALLTPATRSQIAGFAEQYSDVPKQNAVNDFKMAALNRCAQAAEWLGTHAEPAAAAEAKAAILAACKRVAAQSKESGPFSFGGDAVDALEESTIAEIGRALAA